MQGLYGNIDFLNIHRAIDNLVYIRDCLAKDNPDCVKALDYVISELKKELH